MDALILAAGKGTRMGGRKARLLIAGESLLAAHLRRALDAGCSRIVAVVHPDDVAWASALVSNLGLDSIAESTTAPSTTPLVSVVASAEPEQAGSLARGLSVFASAPPRSPRQPHGLDSGISSERLGEDDDVIYIMPVDSLPPRAETIQKLLQSMTLAVLAATPLHKGRGGHPVLVRMTALEPYLRGERPPLRDVLASLTSARVRVEVDDSRVASDLDEPEDLVAVTGAPPSFL
jgi:CTP:molybdopterin cytidylyltransferase MocA